MVNRLHCGITANPDETLPDGSQEIGMRALISGGHPLKAIGRQLAFKWKRARRNKMSAEKRWDMPEKGSEPLLSELLERIQEERKRGTVVSVLAPWYEDNTLSKGEGYLRRIVETDTRILANFFCIYFYESPYYRVDRVVADQISENRIYIRYNANYRAQREFAEMLIAACDICYSHSVLRIIPAEGPERPERWLNLFSGNVRHLLDVHGAVVDESILLGNETDAVWRERAEALYFSDIEGAVVVTEAMRRHFMDKYDCAAASFFSIPFLSEETACDGREFAEKSDPLAVAYAGGCQAWQNIPLMQQAVKQQIALADYYMFVSEPDAFFKSWGDQQVPENVVVKTAGPEEIRTVYRKAHYGFILRDDSVVNRVACPAKIMEYMQFGIVPIMKFAEIGDFKTLGLQYLPVKQFMDGNLPSEPERAHMAQVNMDILRRLEDEYAHKAERIIDFIERYCTQDREMKSEGKNI